MRDSATLVRGVDRDSNFDHEPRPKRDLDEAALAAHADAIGRQVKALYSGTDKQTNSAPDDGRQRIESGTTESRNGRGTQDASRFPTSRPARKPARRS